MWQLASAATNASSGSTALASEYGTGTDWGELEAARTTPPSKLHRWARLYRLSTKGALPRSQNMTAEYWFKTPPVAGDCRTVRKLTPLLSFRQHIFGRPIGPGLRHPCGRGRRVESLSPNSGRRSAAAIPQGVDAWPIAKAANLAAAAKVAAAVDKRAAR